jgi:hypothetical protein
MTLAGPDGQPAVDAATGRNATMEELLRRRGILAVGDVPSAFNHPVPSGQGEVINSGIQTGSAVGDALAGAPEPVAPVQEAAFSPEDASIAEALAAEGADDSLLDDLLTLGLIGAGTYAAWKALQKLRGGKAANTPSVGNTPPNAGGTTDPIGPNGGGPRGPTVLYPQDMGTNARPGLPDAAPIDAEFTEVEPQRQLGNQKLLASPAANSAAANQGGAVDGTKTQHSNQLHDFSPPEGSRPATRVELGARQAVQSRTLPSNDNPVFGVDDLSDLTDSEVRQAQTMTDQVLAERIRGRQAKFENRNHVGTTRHAGAPTAPLPDKPETGGHSGVFHEMVARIRKLKAENARVLTRGVRK